MLSDPQHPHRDPKRTEEYWVNYLRNAVKPLVGKPQGYEDEVKQLARLILPYFLAHKVTTLLINHWGRRCDPPVIEDIFDLVKQAVQDLKREREQLAAAQRGKDGAQREAARRRFTAAEETRRKKLEQRKRNGKLTRKLASELGVSTRQAHMLRTEGTTSLERARRMATILGTDVSEHLRRRRPRSRRQRISDLMLSIEADGCSFEDFVMSFVRAGTIYFDRALVDNLKETAHTGKGLAAIKRLDHLYAHTSWLQAKHPEQFARIPYLWADYQFWRLERMVAIAQFDINDSIVFEPGT